MSISKTVTLKTNEESKWIQHKYEKINDIQLRRYNEKCGAISWHLIRYDWGPETDKTQAQSDENANRQPSQYQSKLGSQRVNGPLKENTKINTTLEISKYPLSSYKMRYPGLTYKLSNAMNIVGNVRATR